MIVRGGPPRTLEMAGNSVESRASDRRWRASGARPGRRSSPPGAVQGLQSLVSFRRNRSTPRHTRYARTGIDAASTQSVFSSGQMLFSGLTA
jgi:hypothetical protein